MNISQTDGVSLTVSGPVATIAFSNIQKRNAFGLQTWLALRSLLEEADGAPHVRVIVVRGQGGNFGSGNDISEIAQFRGKPDEAMAFGAAMADAMRACECTKRPVIMVIEGMCYGAAVALALCGDLRIAADNAVIAITPAKLGAVYLQSDIHRLIRTIGVGQSNRLIYLAEPVDAAEAVRIGLIDKVAPNTAFETHVESFIGAIAKHAMSTLSETKEMARRATDTPAETPASLGRFVAATQSEDFSEGVQAFLEKRPPVFRSRAGALSASDTGGFR